jgi:hypothetical protein
MSDQKNWDAAVIKIWRNNGCISDAKSLFFKLGGKRITECDPPLNESPLKIFLGG